MIIIISKDRKKKDILKGEVFRVYQNLFSFKAFRKIELLRVKLCDLCFYVTKKKSTKYATRKFDSYLKSKIV